MPKITVIVPAFNSSRFLPRCLDSVLAQGEKSIEIVVVNDGSTDDTEDVLATYSARNPTIRVISQRNAGVSSARNTGLSVATGRYVMFLDADDWIDATLVEDMTERLRLEEAQIGIFGVSFDYHDELDFLTSSTVSLPTESVIRRGEPFSSEIITGPFMDLIGYSSNKIYLRDWLLDRKLNFDEEMSLFEDLDFGCRALTAAKAVALQPKAYIHYVRRPRISLSTMRGPEYLAQRVRAIRALDDLLAHWGFDETIRRRERTRLSALSLWGALSTAAKLPGSIRNLNKMMAWPGAAEITIYARQRPIHGWRAKWAAYTAGYGHFRLALSPLVLRNKCLYFCRQVKNIRTRL